MPSKPAKVLSNFQVEAMLEYLATTRHALRNRLIFLLSVDAGLKAREIAGLSWWNTNDCEGQVGWSFCLLDKAGNGRMVPISNRLRETLIQYRRSVPHAGLNVIFTERALATSAHVITDMFYRWYRRLGLEGYSSHSGRRTFIVSNAQTVLPAYVQTLAGHKSIRTTLLYVRDVPRPKQC
jgi:integrase/recombinase XerD